MSMFLFEIVTGAIGESYVRCYCQAESTVRARELFFIAHPEESIAVIRIVADFDSREEVVTVLDDAGFPDKYDVPLGFPSIAEAKERSEEFTAAMDRMREEAKTDPQIAAMFDHWQDKVISENEKRKEFLRNFPVGSGRAKLT